MMPQGVDTKALVTAVNCGKMTLQMLVSPKTPAAGEAKREAVMRAWPALVQIVTQMMGDIMPRDKGAASSLRGMAKDAFDSTHSTAEPLENVIQPVITEMTDRFAAYVMG